MNCVPKIILRDGRLWNDVKFSLTYDGELLSAEAGGQKIRRVFDTEGVSGFECGYKAADFLFHVVFSVNPMIWFPFPKQLED